MMSKGIVLDFDGDVGLPLDDRADDDRGSETSGTCSTDGSEVSFDEESGGYDSENSSCWDSVDEEELLEALAAMDMTGKRTTPLRRSWSADAIASKEFSSTQVSVLLNQIRNTHDLKPSPMTSIIQADAPSAQQSKKNVHSKPFGFPSKQRTKAARRASAVSSLPPSLELRRPVPEQSRGSNDQDPMSPEAVLSEILSEAGESLSELICSDVDDYFVPITEDRIKSYTSEIVSAIRKEDIDGLRRMYYDEKANMDCCNQFGETVLHLACRRSLPRVVDFLIHEVKADLRVRDDYGRTPMHDACWASDFNKELVLLLVTEWPDLLFVKDKRGSTPLSYIRKTQWEDWRTFLYEHKELFRPKMLSSLNPAAGSSLSAVSA